MSPSAAVIDMYPFHTTGDGVRWAKPFSIETLPDDPDGQVECTVAKMIERSQRDACTPEIQRDARHCLMLGGGDPLLGIHRWIRSHMVFKTDAEQTERFRFMLPGPDHYFVEAFTDPVDVSRLIAAKGIAEGDCDDFHMYCSSLLTALQVACSYCTVAASDQQPRDYSHIYVVAYLDGARIPMDTSHGQFVGWETPNRLGRRKEWPVCSGPVGKLEAVIGIGLTLALVALFHFSRRIL